MKLTRVFFTLSVLSVTTTSVLAQTQVDRADAIASHDIQAILDSISATNIRSYLDTLVGFYTRHTLSDTTSDSVGVGAARRWVFGKFQELSQASGGRLQPAYFDFNATICGVTNEHRNVMAILPGTVTPDRYFVVSGHLDNRGDPVSACTFQSVFSPGANDDGSGTAVSIELARVLSQYQFESSLVFMAVVGEDEGLYGSEAYAAYAQTSNIRIDGMITNDVVGNIVGSNGIVDSLSVRMFSSVDDTSSHRQFSRYVKLKSEFYYPSFTINLIPAQDRPGRGGDHQSFQAHGYTAIRFTEPNENLNNQHTATDVVDSMSPAYTARVARANAVGLASLADAPERPHIPQAFDPGTGTQAIIQWTQTNTEPDFAGYRVAVRDSGGLFYTTITDVGNALIDTVDGLTPGVPVYIGISAYDTAGNESIFSKEVFIRPQAVPDAPSNAASMSLQSLVHLSWTLSPQLDVTKYRIYRSTSFYDGFALYDSVGPSTTTYDDNGAASHLLYYYRIRAVDNEQNESLPTTTLPGQLATHDSGILIVDDTKDGAGGFLSPTDGAVDSFYQSLVSRIAGPVTEYDIPDSLLSGRPISDADLGIYSTVIWHSDVRTSPVLYTDSTEIREYLDLGGHLILGGWKLSAALKSGGGVSTTIFPSGTFVPDYLKVDTVKTTLTLQPDFYQAISAASGYPTMTVDSVKIPNYSGNLVNTDVFQHVLTGGQTDIIYSHHSRNPSSTYEGKAVASRYLGSDYKVVFFDLPLYYMKFDSAQKAMERALLDCNELLSVEDKPGWRVPLEFALLQNHPNPFNPSTAIEYAIPVRQHVRLVVYDLLGRLVGTLVDGMQDAGHHSVRFDANRLSTGIYFYRLTAVGRSETRKMLLLK